MDIKKIIEGIRPVDLKEIEKVQQRIDGLAKPPGSLGLLEAYIARVVAIRGDCLPLTKGHILMCADNGVVEEGVSPSPKVYTRMQCENFVKGYGTVGALARQQKVALQVIDIGVDDEIVDDRVVKRKVRRGTGNIARGPAMTEIEALKGIEIGIEAVAGQDYDLIGTGEMGIGNTTTSSCLLQALLDVSIEECVGRGAGLDCQGVQHKKDIVRRALEVNQVSAVDNPLTLLAKVGGLDIAGLVGVFLGSAYYQKPVIMDGFISGVAALLATRFNPFVKDYIIPSHYSKEKGFSLILEALKFEAPLHLGMALGEGSAAILMMSLLESALYILRETGTIEEMIGRRHG